MGSLTGVVASKSVTEASKGTLGLVGNQPKSAMAQGCLTGRPTSRSGAKAGHSDPVIPRGRVIAQKDKRYSGDNRLIAPRAHIDGAVWHLDVGSSHPGAGEKVPRVRLFAD